MIRDLEAGDAVAVPLLELEVQFELTPIVSQGVELCIGEVVFVADATHDEFDVCVSVVVLIDPQRAEEHRFRKVLQAVRSKSLVKLGPARIDAGLPSLGGPPVLMSEQVRELRRRKNAGLSQSPRARRIVDEIIRARDVR